MKIAIYRHGNDIRTVTDYSDIDSKSEISHILAELKLIERDLIELWEKYIEDE